MLAGQVWSWWSLNSTSRNKEMLLNVRDSSLLLFINMFAISKPDVCHGLETYAYSHTFVIRLNGLSGRQGSALYLGTSQKTISTTPLTSMHLTTVRLISILIVSHCLFAYFPVASTLLESTLRHLAPTRARKRSYSCLVYP